MKILYLSPWFPFPPTNGSELRINALLRGLSAKHDVTLISFYRRPVNPAGMEEARQRLDSVHLVPWREFNPDSRAARVGFLSTRPRSVVDTYSDQMAGLIERIVASQQYDVVVASEITMADYWPAWGDLPSILDDVELAVLRDQGQTADSPTIQARRHLMWVKMRAYVRRLLPRFSAVTVVSERERDLLRGVAPGFSAVEVIPNGIEWPSHDISRTDYQADTLVFTGAFTYGVNHEAMVWFLSEVYPLVKRAAPQVKLVITGDHAGKPIPSAPDVIQTGFVDDVRSVVAGAAVSVVPILQGGGTRLKILEAMALGTPVVSTAKGAEGLDVIDGRHLLVADTAEAFAAAILNILHDDYLRRSLVDDARRLIQAKYDWRVILPEFLNLVERIGCLSGPQNSSPLAIRHDTQ